MKFKVKASFLPDGHIPDKEYSYNPFKEKIIGTIEIDENIMDKYMNNTTARSHMYFAFTMAIHEFFLKYPQS